MPVPDTATQVATYVGHHYADRERGSLLFEDTPEAGLVLAVFGNDGYVSDRRVGREVEFVRLWLVAAGAREQGFGISRDGRTWALLIRVSDPGYRTPAGRAFYAEMARMEVEEEVGRAWAEACRVDGDRNAVSGRRAG